MKLFGAIEKFDELDDGTIIVEGFASSESLDSQGDIVTAAAMKAALPDYMKFGNIREMHQAKAAGVAIKGEVMDDGRTKISAHIVDSEAIKKVQAGVYKGLSVGIKILKRNPMQRQIIEEIVLKEISLVDRPANPDALLEVWKGDDMNKDISALTVIEEQKTAAAVEETAAAAVPAIIEVVAPTVADDVKTEISQKTDSADTQKSLWDVQNMAGIIDSLKCLCGNAEFESAIEGDGSLVPVKLRAALSSLVEAFKIMVEEEAAEIVGDTVDETAMKAHGADIQKLIAVEVAKAVKGFAEVVKSERVAHKQQIEELEKRFKDSPAAPKGYVKAAPQIVSKKDETSNKSDLGDDKQGMESASVFDLVKSAHQNNRFLINS
jgi:hypothetical protein